MLTNPNTVTCLGIIIKPIISGYDRCAEDFNAIWTERNLTGIRSNCEIGNETYGDLELHMKEFTSRVKNRFFSLTRDALHSPSRETLHAVGLPDIFEDGAIENIAEEIRSGF